MEYIPADHPESGYIHADLKLDTYMLIILKQYIYADYPETGYVHADYPETGYVHAESSNRMLRMVMRAGAFVCVCLFMRYE